MKSIFSGDYSSNINRINQSDQPARQPDSKDGAGNGGFSDVLAKLENHGRHPASELIKPGQNQSNSATEKNIARPNIGRESANQSPVTPDFSNLITHFSIPAAPDGPPICPMPNWGKSNPAAIDRGVKKLALSAVIGTKGLRSVESHQHTAGLKPPATPVLRSVTRYQGEHVINSMAFGSDDIRNVIETAGKFHGIDPALGMAVATAESSLRPDAVSRDGFKSKGLFQLLDTTGKEMQTRMGMKEKYDPFDPALNAHLGVGYLRYLHDIFSDETDLGSNLHTVPVRSAGQLEKLAVAAFNAGEGNVAQAQARAKREGKDPTDYDAIKPFLPASTREYVTRVTNLRNEIDLGADSTDIA